MLPHACRFVPTCSQYAIEAVERHGVVRGGLLAIARLLRCQPFARAGFDPLPRHFHAPTSLWQKSRFLKSHSSGAKARTDNVGFTARLKSCPFKTRVPPQAATREMNVTGHAGY
jgi:putative membrane protein insertion efficiency factor